MLPTLNITNFTTKSGLKLNIPLSYELFGPPLHTAPVVVVNHALTGNSRVAGTGGWWSTLVGASKVVDTSRYTVLCFNVPGNGFDGNLIEDIHSFTAADIAAVFLKGLNQLGIKHLYALIGGSVGGSIGWEMMAQQPGLADYFIPIATDYKTSDWLHSQCLVQKFLLEDADRPLEKARIHAMLCYRTPESLNQRFQNEMHDEKQILKSHDWLNYHGEALSKRFTLQAYRMMNHLLMTINADPEALRAVKAIIHLVAVDSDLFFPAFEMKNTVELLKDTNRIHYHEIKSVHGHDAFLMEYAQLEQILASIF